MLKQYNFNKSFKSGQNQECGELDVINAIKSSIFQIAKVLHKVYYLIS